MRNRHRPANYEPLWMVSRYSENNHEFVVDDDDAYISISTIYYDGRWQVEFDVETYSATGEINGEDGFRSAAISCFATETEFYPEGHSVGAEYPGFRVLFASDDRDRLGSRY